MVNANQSYICPIATFYQLRGIRMAVVRNMVTTKIGVDMALSRRSHSFQSGYGPEFTRKYMVTALSAVLLAGQAAQLAQAQESAGQIDEVVVIGSQIRGARINGALPVSVIGEEAIAASAAVSGDDLFRSIPEAGDISFNGTYLGGGNSNAARGDVSTVSLRGLAQGNTLLLLNGRRSVVHPTSQTDNETPVFGYNANALPVS